MLKRMRALVLQYQNDPETYTIADQYLFGDNIMVCPVTVKGAQTRTIYLPEGTWFNYRTGKQYQGRQYIHILTPVNELPLFVKAGSIIPMQSARRYMDEKPVDELTLDIFPGIKASGFNLYEDDGASLKYQQGDMALTHIGTMAAADGLHLDIETPQGKFTPVAHTYLAKIHWNNNNAPLAVVENNEALKQAKNADALAKNAGWYYDKTNNLLWIKAVHSNRAAIHMIIK